MTKGPAVSLALLTLFATACGDVQAGVRGQGKDKAQPPPGQRVAADRLAGAHEGSGPEDGQADVVAIADGTNESLKLAAYLEAGQPCMALVKPAPGLVVCEKREADLSQMVATGTAGPTEGEPGVASVFFGWGPPGTARIQISSGGRKFDSSVYDSGQRYKNRAFFVISFAAPNRRVEFASVDDSGHVISRRTLGA